MNNEINDLLKSLIAKNKEISPQIAELIIKLDKKVERDKIDNFRSLLIDTYEN